MCHKICFHSLSGWSLKPESLEFESGMDRDVVPVRNALVPHKARCHRPAVSLLQSECGKSKHTRLVLGTRSTKQPTNRLVKTIRMAERGTRLTSLLRTVYSCTQIVTISTALHPALTLQSSMTVQKNTYYIHRYNG